MAWLSCSRPKHNLLDRGNKTTQDEYKLGLDHMAETGTLGWNHTSCMAAFSVFFPVGFICLKTWSPVTSVVLDSTATLFTPETPEVFCGLTHFTCPSLGTLIGYIAHDDIYMVTMPDIVSVPSSMNRSDKHTEVLQILIKSTKCSHTLTRDVCALCKPLCTESQQHTHWNTPTNPDERREQQQESQHQSTRSRMLWQ